MNAKIEVEEVEPGWWKATADVPGEDKVSVEYEAEDKTEALDRASVMLHLHVPASEAESVTA